MTAPARTGGLESVVEALARGQHAAGHGVAVAAVLTEDDPAHPFLGGLEAAGVAVHRLIVRRRAYRLERARVAELIARMRPDIVHTHGSRTDVINGPVSRRAGVPAVATVHGFLRSGLKGRVYERIHRHALRRFDAVVAVSAMLAEELIGSGVEPARVHRIANAWPGGGPLHDRAAARAALGAPADGFLIGWVGRLSREKGADVLVDALARLADCPFWTACVVGAGPEREAIERRAARAGIAGRIRWCGMVRRAGSYFRAFDVFALSSRTEGMPITILEAMAGGVPIVATRVGGVSEATGADGALLVPAEDPAALAAAIRRVYEDPHPARARAAAARRRLEAEFAPAAWLARYEALYRHVTVQARPARRSPVREPPRLRPPEQT